MSSAGEPSPMAEPEADTTRMAGLNIQDEMDSASPGSSFPTHSPPSANPHAISNNAPGFKYKYPQAKPTPPGADDTEWNKIYTAADSRNYNKHNKSATESKKYRERGDTYELALRMLEEKREKARRAAADGPASKKAKVSATKKTEMFATIKKEPSSSSRDASPSGDKLAAMGIAEKIKAEGRARKQSSAGPSSDRDTPTPVIPKPPNSPAILPPPKVERPPVKKKGIASVVKKAPKKHVEKSKVGEKVATPSSGRTSQTPGPKNAISSGESTDVEGEYCICRGPDDHRMMVCCEGGCDEWYHCSCVNIEEKDAKELLDVYICHKCQTGTRFTTWKRMCRYYNVGKHLGSRDPCRKAARINATPPSKYCSDECKTLFWRFVKSQMRDDDEPSIGGALSQKDVAFILKQVKTAAEIHELGAKPRLPKREDADPNRPVGLDYFTADEELEVAEIKRKKAVIETRIRGYQDQQKVLIMMSKRAKTAAQQPNLEIKDICGYDSRLAFNEAQFARWARSAEGRTALETDSLGARTDETRSIGAMIQYPGYHASTPVAPAVSEALQSMCLRARKKCKHGNWREVHNQDYVYNQRILKEELGRLGRLETEMVEGAETREATRDYYADNVTVRLF